MRTLNEGWGGDLPSALAVPAMPSVPVFKFNCSWDGCAGWEPPIWVPNSCPLPPLSILGTSVFGSRLLICKMRYVSNHFAELCFQVGPWHASGTRISPLCLVAGGCAFANVLLEKVPLVAPSHFFISRRFPPPRY